MRSLWLKLVGAFVLVLLVGGAVDLFLVRRATQGEFSRYISQGGLAWAEQLAPVLAGYYAESGSWQGVEAALRNPWQGMMGMGMPGGESGWSNERWMGRDMGMMGMQRSGPAGSRANPWWDMDSDMMMGGDMGAWMGTRLLLADARGEVVADTASAAQGTRLEAADLDAGVPVMLDGARVGTLLPVSNLADTASPASELLSDVHRWTWVAGLVAAIVALVLGLVLFRQIVAPVKAVTTAAQRIADGDLDQRVPVASRDEIGQMANTFNQMADSLAHDRQLRGNMVADIAHELGTPLSILQSHLEAMLDGVLPASPPEIASLHDETSHLSRLVADLRLLSLAEAGQLKLELAEVDLGYLVRETVERMSLQAQDGGVALRTEVEAGLPRVLADAGRMGQVLGNLLDNAVQHTAAGGQVIVRASARAKAGERPSVVVTVADEGRGIAPEDLPYVFDRFYRADKSRNRQSGGSGIGLAIVKQVVEAHGGEVWVASDGLNQGSVFSFTIPAVDPHLD